MNRLSAVETMRELIRHSVPTRWGVEGDGNHLKMCAQLANLVPVYRVRTFHNLREIRGVLDRILKHREGTKQ